MIRDILVHVDGSGAGRKRVRFAIGLARRMGAQLSGIHITPPADVPPLYKPSLVPGVAAHIAASLTCDRDAAAEIFKTETATLPGVRWSTFDGDMVQGICQRARYADLVVLGQYESQGFPEAHPLPVAHAAVMHCGRPVLVTPAAVASPKLGRVVVAWDGSREAVRAVHDALPLLRRARSVRIVTVLHDSLRDAADRDSLLAHLRNHKIRIEANFCEITSMEEHHALRAEIEAGHYDLVVMGAYSHPVWLEFILGGATKSILISATTPIFVSH